MGADEMVKAGATALARARGDKDEAWGLYASDARSILEAVGAITGPPDPPAPEQGGEDDWSGPDNPGSPRVHVGTLVPIEALRAAEARAAAAVKALRTLGAEPPGVERLSLESAIMLIGTRVSEVIAILSGTGEPAPAEFLAENAKNSPMSECGIETDTARRFGFGDRVTKTKGSSWTGKVVGGYSTELTPLGYCVESENEPNSVQNYPEAALEPAPAPSSAVGEAIDALKPFAEAIDDGVYERLPLDHTDLWEAPEATAITYGDLRRAKRALASLATPQTGEKTDG